LADLNTAVVRNDLEGQIADLKKEMAKMSKTIAARASDAVEDASGAIDDVKSSANGAARTVSKQAHAVGDAIRQNPATAATVLSSAGLIGIAIGLAAGYLLAGGSKRW
jgi:ABC-type transporter Mla subunit MlaD